ARLRSISSKLDTLDADTGQNMRSSYGVLEVDDKTMGAYLQQTWQPAGWLDLNGGARLDAERRFDPGASPRFAASVHPWKNGTLKGVYAEAFRAPTWGESSYSGIAQIVAHDLRPERVRSAEASIEQRAGTHRLLFGAFRSWWSDLISLHVLSR